MGNYLCGPPVSKNCITERVPNDGGSSEGSKGRSKVKGFYMSIVVGFVMGFWGVVAPLFLIRSWRHVYYQNLDHVGRKFNSSMPNSLYSSNHLQFLDMSRNNFQDEISSAIGNLSSLIHLDQGKLPASLGDLCKLKEIDLSSNLMKLIKTYQKSYTACLNVVRIA
ncbi:hypothetical protein V6N13_014764 [Hibiscus sabdariffa]